MFQYIALVRFMFERLTGTKTSKSEILRTPEEAFQNLPEFPYKEHYLCEKKVLPIRRTICLHENVATEVENAFWYGDARAFWPRGLTKTWFAFSLLCR